MPSPEHRDYAALLVRKAIEKSLKAVLVLLGVEFPRTHDRGFLTEMLAPEGVPLPPELAASRELHPLGR